MIKQIRFSFSIFLISIIAFLPAFAGEGMWLPLLLKSLNEAEMQSMGMKMSVEDIYSVNQGSLKDAIVHFNGNCTAAIISDQGLILTNHHCGYRSIQGQSSPENNYLKDGFWARNTTEELPIPTLYVQFIVRMEDVTSSVLHHVTDEMTQAEKKSIIDKNIKTTITQFPKESWQEVTVKSFFEGNQYFAFVTETHKDIRLVGTPPESIGRFGADTDNWVWPRHTGDFAVFRIYAGPENKPATYAPENKPLRPKHFLPLSLDGVKEGDFTLVSGFPGTTAQYLPSFATAQTVDVIDPARIGVRAISLEIMDKYMRVDEDTRLAYAAKYASLSNAWKKWSGEMQGLKISNAVEKKREQERNFMALLREDHKSLAAYGSILPEMKRLYAQSNEMIRHRTLFTEILGGANIELFKLTAYADRLVNAYRNNGEDGFNQQRQRTIELIQSYFKDYRQEIDMEIFDALIKHLITHAEPEFLSGGIFTTKPSTYGETAIIKAADVYANSKLTSEAEFITAIEQGGAYFTGKMQHDMAYQFYMSLKSVLDTTISPAYTLFNDQNQELQKLYLSALMSVYPGKRFWPDANSTLRVMYGKVEPYAPRDGMTYKAQTFLDGVIEKYIPGDYEFDVHPKLIELYKEKAYGPYGENGKMPLAFIGSNHTTGGTSGSPAVDVHGNMIGLSFDRVWEGTMSDLYYDSAICRNIMVDIRYILFVIDKFAGAGYLLEEMKLVHPKSGKKRKR